MIEETVALIMFTGVVLYACFGGADFGVGIWDLTAGNDRKGGPLRTLIDRSIGPVWEANHVWLIFVLVYLWSGFPEAFAAICETLWIPLSLAGLGIVFRGATFVFRKFAPTMALARFYGVLFAASSVITPFFFGTIAGAVASGRVPADGKGDTWSSWTGTTSLIGGTIAVLACAFLAAVFLTHEAGRSNDQTLIDVCRRRAIASGLVTGVAVMVFLVPLRTDAPELFDGLTGQALPIVLVSAIAGTGALLALATRRVSSARTAAVIAVASVVSGWGIAQYPYVLAETATIDDAAGARPTLVALVMVFGLAAVTVVPALAYLYWVTQRREWLSHTHDAVQPSTSIHSRP